MVDVVRISELTCPECGFKKAEIMSVDSCQWFYECQQCHSILKPQPGDCCVYCSFGTVPCPPIQLNNECCSKSHER